VAQLLAVLRRKGLSTAGDEKALNERLQRRLDIEEMLMNSQCPPEDEDEGEEMEVEDIEEEGEVPEEEVDSDEEGEEEVGEEEGEVPEEEVNSGEEGEAGDEAEEEVGEESGEEAEGEEDESQAEEEVREESGEEVEEDEKGAKKRLVFIKAKTSLEDEESEDEGDLRHRERAIKMASREKKFGEIADPYPDFDDLDARLDSTLDELEEAGKSGISYGIVLSELEVDVQETPGGSSPYPKVTKAELDLELKREASKLHQVLLPGDVYDKGMFLVDFLTAIGMHTGWIDYDLRKISFYLPWPSREEVKLDADRSKIYETFVNGNKLDFRYYHRFPVGNTWFVTASE
jgi:hypothetical protein